jgi:hypothetical protein
LYVLNLQKNMCRLFWIKCSHIYSAFLSFVHVLKWFQLPSMYFDFFVPFFQMTKKHNDDCKRLLGLMGVPVVEVSFLLLSISCFKYFLH